MSVDRLLQARAAEGRPLRVGLYGAGFMARGIVNQIAHAVPGMRLAVICNRSVDKAIEAYRQAGQQATRVDDAAALS